MTATPEMIEAALNEAGSQWGDFNSEDNRRALMKAALNAALAAQPVAVKPLEWDDIGLSWRRAECPVGIYTIEPSAVWHFEQVGEVLSYTASDLEAATAAAQADYERRILSALVTTPSAPHLVAVKPLVEFAKEMIEIAFEGCDADGGTIQDAAVKYGLLEQTVFDPSAHTDRTGFSEAGDWWYVYSGPLVTTPPDLREETEMLRAALRSVPKKPGVTSTSAEWDQDDEAQGWSDAFHTKHMRSCRSDAYNRGYKAGRDARAALEASKP